MNHLTRTAAGLGTALALAVPTALVVAAPAHADDGDLGGEFEAVVEAETIRECGHGEGPPGTGVGASER